MPLSNARSFFEYLREHPDPIAFLEGITFPPRDEPFFEEEWIDFKGNPQEEKHAKKIWSKALSGYGNITDGILVWGIDARRIPEQRNIDAAGKLNVIPDPELLQSQLRSWVRDATNPPVMGVEYLSFPRPSGDGFLICFVPESRHKPHRAEFADKHYYYRAGDNFLCAEPGLLRTLFYPRSQPFLRIEVTSRFELDHAAYLEGYRKSPSPDGFAHLINSSSNVFLNARLHNTGTATAKDVFVIVEPNKDLNYHQGPDWQLREHRPSGAALLAKRPFHPSEITELFSVSLQRNLTNRAATPGDPDCWDVIPHFDKISLIFLIYADNSESQQVEVEFLPEDFNSKGEPITKMAVPLL